MRKSHNLDDVWTGKRSGVDNQNPDSKSGIRRGDPSTTRPLLKRMIMKPNRKMPLDTVMKKILGKKWNYLTGEDLLKPQFADIPYDLKLKILGYLEIKKGSKNKKTKKKKTKKKKSKKKKKKKTIMNKRSSK
jgi:hypothetical protein